MEHKYDELRYDVYTLFICDEIEIQITDEYDNGEIYIQIVEIGISFHGMFKKLQIDSIEKLTHLIELLR